MAHRLFCRKAIAQRDVLDDYERLATAEPSWILVSKTAVVPDNMLWKESTLYRHLLFYFEQHEIGIVILTHIDVKDVRRPATSLRNIISILQFTYWRWSLTLKKKKTKKRILYKYIFLLLVTHLLRVFVGEDITMFYLFVVYNLRYGAHIVYHIYHNYYYL